MNRAALAAAAEDDHSPPDDIVCVGASRADTDPGKVGIEQCYRFSPGPGGSSVIAATEFNYSPHSLGGRVKIFVGLPNGVYQQQQVPGAKSVQALLRESLFQLLMRLFRITSFVEFIL